MVTRLEQISAEWVCISVEYKLTRINSFPHGHPWSIIFLPRCFFCDNFTKTSEITLKSSEITFRGQKLQLSVEVTECSGASLDHNEYNIWFNISLPEPSYVLVVSMWKCVSSHLIWKAARISLTSTSRRSSEDQVSLSCWHIEVQTKWLSFRKHFEFILLERSQKIIAISNFTGICSQWFN